MALTLDDIDLLEDTWAAGVPHEQFDLLRREAPVHWHDHPDAPGLLGGHPPRRRRGRSAATTRRSPPSSGPTFIPTTRPRRRSRWSA